MSVKKFYRSVCILTDVSSMAFMVMLVAVTILQIFFRFVLHNSLSWPEEVSRAFFGWSMLLAFAMTMETNGHLRIDVIRSFTSPRVQRWLDGICWLLTVLFLLVFMYLSGVATYKMYLRHMSTVALKWKIWTLWLCMPVGCLATLMQAVRLLIMVFHPSPEENGIAKEGRA